MATIATRNFWFNLVLYNFWQRNIFVDTLASVDSSKKYVRHFSSDSQAQVLWTYMRASFGASPSWSNYKWVTPELGVILVQWYFGLVSYQYSFCSPWERREIEMMWKKVSIPYQSSAPSCCGCEKSQAELCPSDLITSTSVFWRVQRPHSNTAPQEW